MCTLGSEDAAPMAALCSILFHNSDDDTSPSSGKTTTTHDLSGGGSSRESTGSAATRPLSQWQAYKSRFLAGLIRCAGRRHSLGLTDSGCATSRGIATGRKNTEKTRSYVSWDENAPAAASDQQGASSLAGIARTRPSSSLSRTRTTLIEGYSKALRPMLTLYAVFDQLSKEFVAKDDEVTEESSERLATKLESCYKAVDIQHLIQIAEIDAGNDVICKYFEKGVVS